MHVQRIATNQPRAVLHWLWSALLAVALLAALLPGRASAAAQGDVIHDLPTPTGGLAHTPQPAPGGAAFLKGIVGGPQNAPVLGSSFTLFKAGGAQCEGSSALQNDCVAWIGRTGQSGTSPEFLAAAHCNPFATTMHTFCPTPPSRVASTSHLRTHHPQIGANTLVRPYTIDLRDVRGGTPRNDVLILDLRPALTAGVVYGGLGDDRITIRSATRDVVFLRRGDNRLVADSSTSLGMNVLQGGTGRDFISSVDGSRDIVRCGGNLRDHVRIDLTDTVANPQRCRIVERAPVDQHPVVRVPGRQLRVRGNRRARVRLRCPQEATSRCRGQLRILRGRKGNRTIGRARYNIRQGQRGTVRLRVRRTPNRVRVATREIGPDEREKESVTQLRLRRR